jgi:gamma-D-glutamyl-L-lysine dipeptidyl-peptidase
MQKIICCESVAPMRAEANHRAEMVSQMLYGETAYVLAEQDDFIKIKCHYDDYEGWVNRLQVWYTDSYHRGFVVDGAGVLYSGDFEPKTLIPPGGRSYFNFSINPEPLKMNVAAAKLAKIFLQVPYLWGGRSTLGIDCSGLSQTMYNMCHYKLPRDAYQQAELGELRTFGEHKMGDLAFFANAQGRITHVGVMLEGNEIVHAYGKVRIDDLNETGILNRDSKTYSHQLSFIKSYQ